MIVKSLTITHPRCLRRRGDQMKRREFIMLLGGAMALPLAVRAEVSPNRPLIAWLSGGTPQVSASFADNFLRGMRGGLTCETDRIRPRNRAGREQNRTAHQSDRSQGAAAGSGAGVFSADRQGQDSLGGCKPT